MLTFLFFGDKFSNQGGSIMENKTSAMNIQVDTNVKKEATMVLTELGLSMSSAINLFLKQVVKRMVYHLKLLMLWRIRKY